jgi:hypothetical protein
MRLHLLAVLGSLLVATVSVSADPRDSGGSDTSRHHGREGQAQGLGLDARPLPDRTPAGRLDPAVRQFWSERCLNQRRFGLPHTGDCDHPAYSGGGYGAPYPDGGYGPQGGYGRRGGHGPRGGGVIIERGHHRFGRPPASAPFRSGAPTRHHGRW